MKWIALKALNGIEITLLTMMSVLYMLCYAIEKTARSIQPPIQHWEGDDV